MKLNEVKDNPGATKNAKRIGRGVGSMLWPGGLVLFSNSMGRAAFLASLGRPRRSCGTARNVRISPLLTANARQLRLCSWLLL